RLFMGDLMMTDKQLEHDTAADEAELMFWTTRVARDYLEDLAECGTIRPAQLARLARANARIAQLVYRDAAATGEWIKRDWLHAASTDGDIYFFGLAELPGLNGRDVLRVLKNAIVRLANGEDCSPYMRANIARDLGGGEVELAFPRQKRRGNQSNFVREAAIAVFLEVALANNGGRREAAIQDLADAFNVTPRSIERSLAAMARHKDTTP